MTQQRKLFLHLLLLKSCFIIWHFEHFEIFCLNPFCQIFCQERVYTSNVPSTYSLSFFLSLFLSLSHTHTHTLLLSLSHPPTHFYFLSFFLSLTHSFLFLSFFYLSLWSCFFSLSVFSFMSLSVSQASPSISQGIKFNQVEPFQS